MLKPEDSHKHRRVGRPVFPLFFPCLTLSLPRTLPLFPNCVFSLPSSPSFSQFPLSFLHHTLNFHPISSPSLTPTFSPSPPHSPLPSPPSLHLQLGSFPYPKARAITPIPLDLTKPDSSSNSSLNPSCKN